MIANPDEAAYPDFAESAPGRWALGSGRGAYFMLSGETDRVPVLVELKEVTIEGFASGKPFFDDDARVQVWQEAVHVAPLFLRRPKALQQLNFVTALVSQVFFDLRNDPDNVELRMAVPQVSLGPPLPEDHLAETTAVDANAHASSLDEDLNLGTDTGNLCVVGVVDDGIAFANDRFRRVKNTRSRYLWLQDGNPPEPHLPFGRDLDSGAIDALFAESTYLTAPAGHADWIDEERVYRQDGILNYAEPGHKSLGLSATHGAAVLDAVGGSSPGDPFGEFPIISVQLPTDLVRDASLTVLDPYIFLGCYYILWRSLFVADELGTAALPVVINVSYGDIAGPHDGTSLIEIAMDVLIVLWSAALAPARIVLPAGNSNLSRTHARFRFDATGPDSRLSLPWRVQPDDKTPSYMQIWLPHLKVPTNSVRLRVIPPGERDPDDATDWLEAQTGPPVQYPPVGDPWCEAYFTWLPFPTARGVFEIFLQPTARYDFNADGLVPLLAPAGLWTVELENNSLPFDLDVNGWIQRDDTPFSYPRLGRQSYFDDPCHQRFDAQGRYIEEDSHPQQPPCMIERQGLINAMATGRHTIVVGGYRRRMTWPARYSAAGPITIPAGLSVAHRDGPDAMKVSDDSTAHSGVLAAGSRSGSVVAVNGTSIAAAQVSRWIAEELAIGNPGDRAAVCIRANTDDPLLTPPKPVPERGGCGRITLPALYPRRR